MGSHRLALDSKFQVNSLQDVFCHPFYWQLYGWVDRPLGLVVDLGAHCGHFSMLADTCARVRFGKGNGRYVLVEPNPGLVPVIHRNLSTSALCENHSIHQGLVGVREGTADLWVSSKNYLSASLSRGHATRAVSARYLDLEKLVGAARVDLLKVDIEGAEYDLVRNYPALFGRVDRLMIEIHRTERGDFGDLEPLLRDAGLSPVGEALEHACHRLMMFERKAS